MVYLIYNFCLYECTELLKVYHKARIWIGFSFYCNNELKVMAVPILVGAWAKYFFVFGFTPRGVVKFVCCVEMLFPAYVYRHLPCLSNAAANLIKRCVFALGLGLMTGADGVMWLPCGMIVVTGAAGFIGSYLIGALNAQGFNAVIAVDRFDREDKLRNLEGKAIQERVERDVFIEWLDEHAEHVEFVFHLGARTDTAEFDHDLLYRLNTEYSQRVWHMCVKHQLPLVYASSAATYGLGERGYADREDILDDLKPLNPYGVSKNEFDKWALAQDEKPFFWAGLKFFNVYGPNEYHKGRMASVILHAFRQIKETGGMRLFRSHHPDYANGEQQRDFIYVRDVAAVCMFLMHHRQDSGLYNLGTGQARTFLDLTRAVFAALDVPERIGFIDTPEDIRDKYQYFTEADMDKLRAIGYTEAFTSLEEGVKDYVSGYLMGGAYA